MTTASISLEDAEVGKLYRVEWCDCCATGHFESVLEARKLYEGKVPHSLDGLTFGNGVTIGNDIGYTITEVVNA